MGKFLLAMIVPLSFTLGVLTAPMFTIDDNVVEMDADGICPKAFAGKTCG